ncbi:unnamed protein product [Eruca vesicaria subsp. sativa]|uniref:DUF220 domain-containing protein n=1 Tax=Eruca vesicaria subsp. sativa TaxID=29727 RepID=A0ABC8LWA8_ERUVS|nr:unnamed protein product [Eruca vesicaria subsp. sativa]
MGVFPRFGSWINQKSQQPLKAESKISKNVDSEEDNFELPNKDYLDLKEVRKQMNLWREAEKKHPWHNASPKIKVTRENGFYHMHIELTLGLDPDQVYFFLTDPESDCFFFLMKENKSRKVLFENGPRLITRVEKSVACKVFGVYIPISMHLILDENRKDYMTQYKKERVIFMKEFKGNYKVEPVFVDKERLCKKKIPMTREEYKKCSGGKGKIASKLTLDQFYKPYPPFNLPPLSWLVRGLTIKTSKVLLALLQDMTWLVRTSKPPPSEDSKSASNKHEKH